MNLFSGFRITTTVIRFVLQEEKTAQYYTSQNQFYDHPGFIVETVDTVGAGDSFLASLVSNLIQNKSPEIALERACATGAFVASKAGAVPYYSTLDIEEIINSVKN